jgi:hypothetical protein
MSNEEHLRDGNVRMVQGAVKELIENPVFNLNKSNVVRVDNELYVVTIKIIK